MSDELCHDCGKPITMGQGSYYRRSASDDIGKTYHSTCGDPLGMKSRDAEIARLREALAPFARGAGQIPDNWPDHRALLIDEKHPDNPKKYCLLLARVCDFRRAKDALQPHGDGG